VRAPPYLLWLDPRSVRLSGENRELGITFRWRTRARRSGRSTRMLRHPAMWTPGDLVPNMKSVVTHIGLRGLDDFCWVATQERNIYAACGGDGVLPQPAGYFAEMMATSFWLGPDRSLQPDYAPLASEVGHRRFPQFRTPEDLKRSTASTDDGNQERRSSGERPQVWASTSRSRRRNRKRLSSRRNSPHTGNDPIGERREGKPLAH